MAKKLPETRFFEGGALPWYGPEYALSNLIVYAYYGHKREHAAQIKLVKARGASPKKSL